METILVLLMILLVPIGLFLIGIILIQESKSGGLSGAFGGGGGGESLLGAGASKGLSKVTAYGATLFMVLLIIIGILCKAKERGTGDTAGTKPGPAVEQEEQPGEAEKEDETAPPPTSKEDTKKPEKAEPEKAEPEPAPPPSMEDAKKAPEKAADDAAQPKAESSGEDTGTPKKATDPAGQ